MIVVGLDVRKQSVTAVAIDEAGRRLGEKVVLVGCDQLLSVAGQSGVRIKLHGPGGERNARALVAPPGPPRAYGGRKLGATGPFGHASWNGLLYAKCAGAPWRSSIWSTFDAPGVRRLSCWWRRS